MSRTILITGAAGFIGSTLTKKLLDRSDTVIGIDNFNRYYSPEKKHHNVAEFEKHPHYYLHKADIREAHVMADIFSRNRIDCVVHLAAMAGVRPSIENPSLYADVNVVGTTNILEQMRSAVVPQMVFASSSSVYGNRNRGPFKESERTDKQISPYGATKKAGEMLCHTYAHLYGIKTTCLRFFTAYGPRNRPDMACFKFTDAISNNRPILQFGDGTTGRDYTYIDDIVEGIVRAIDRPQDFEIINLGDSTPVLLKDLIATLEEITGIEAKITQLPMQAGDVTLTFADISKARDLLGWQPKVPIKEGLRRLVSWYRSQQ